MPSLDKNRLNKCLQLFDSNLEDYNVFIETGTLIGGTMVEMYELFPKLYTIELSEKYFYNFNKIKNDNFLYKIKNKFGDTAVVLPKIISKLKENEYCIFWLDAHWSSGDTAKGDKDVPALDECIAIDSLYKAEYGLILIDDLRLFGSSHFEDWSKVTIESLTKCFYNFDIQYIADKELDVLAILLKRKITESIN